MKIPLLLSNLLFFSCLAIGQDAAVSKDIPTNTQDLVKPPMKPLTLDQQLELLQAQEHQLIQSPNKIFIPFLDSTQRMDVPGIPSGDLGGGEKLPTELPEFDKNEFCEKYQDASFCKDKKKDEN